MARFRFIGLWVILIFGLGLGFEPRLLAQDGPTTKSKAQVRTGILSTDLNKMTDANLKTINDLFDDWDLSNPEPEIVALLVGTTKNKKLCDQLDYLGRLRWSAEKQKFSQNCTKLINIIKLRNGLNACFKQTERNVADRLLAAASGTDSAELGCTQPMHSADFLASIAKMSRAEQYRQFQQLIRDSAIENLAERFWRFDKRFGELSKRLKGQGAPKLLLPDTQAQEISEEMCKGGCSPHDKNLIEAKLKTLEEGLIPSPLTDTHKIVEHLNQQFGYLNKALAKVKTGDNWANRPNLEQEGVREAYENYEQQFGALVYSDLGPLVMTPTLQKQFGEKRGITYNTLNWRDWQRSGRIPLQGQWTLPPHNQVSLLDSGLLKVMDEARTSLIQQSQYLRNVTTTLAPSTQSLTDVNKGLQEQRTALSYLLRTQKRAVAKVLLKNPYLSSLVCDLMGEVDREDKSGENTLSASIGDSYASYIPYVGDFNDVFAKPLSAYNSYEPIAREELNAIILGGGNPTDFGDVSRLREKIDGAYDQATLSAAMFLAAPGVSHVVEEGAAKAVKTEAVKKLLEREYVRKLTSKGEKARQAMLDALKVANKTTTRTEESFPVPAHLVDTHKFDGIIKYFREGKSLDEIKDILRKAPRGSEERRILEFLESPEAKENVVLQLFIKLGNDLDFRAGGVEVFTDTEFSGKLVFTRRRTDKEVRNIAKEQLGLKSSEIKPDLVGALRRPSDVRENYDKLTSILMGRGIPREKAREFLDQFLTGEQKTLKARFRKYLSADEIEDINIPGPVEKHQIENSVATKVTDAKVGQIEKGTTAVEIKMDAEDPLTVRFKQKRRFFMSDHIVPEMQDPKNFTKENFPAFKKKILADVKKYGINADSLEEFDEFMNFWKEIHAQDFSFDSQARVIYRRTAFKGRDFEFTVDREILQVDRRTGEMVQAFPWIDRKSGRHFQFDQTSGQFLSQNKDGEVEYVLNPKTKQVWKVNKKGELIPEKGMDPEPVKMAEIKGDPEGVGKVDTPLGMARGMLGSGNKTMNKWRTENGLEPLLADAGKASAFLDARTSFQKTAIVNLSPTMPTRLTFQYHAVSGKFISWSEDKTPKALYELVEEVDSSGEVKRKVYQLIDGTVERGRSIPFRKIK